MPTVRAQKAARVTNRPTALATGFPFNPNTLVFKSRRQPIHSSPPLDETQHALHLYYMSSPTSLRIPEKTKQRIKAAAQRRGVSTNEFMIEAALKEASRPNWDKFFDEHPPVSLPPGSPQDLSEREGFGG